MLSLSPRQHATTEDPDDPWGFGRPDARPPATYGDLVDVDDLDAVGRALRSGPQATTPPASAADPAPRRARARLLVGVFVGATVVAAVGAYWSARSSPPSPSTAASSTGLLVVSSHPDGADVFVDGTALGTTPLVVTLPVGDHRVRLSRASSRPVELVASITAGEDWRRHVTLDPAVPDTPSTTLRVETERAGTAVFVDGVGVGATPLSLTTLPPGEHQVEVRGPGEPVRRTVTLTAGAATSLVISGERPAVATSGWLSVPSPIELQIVENGRLLGVSRSDRIMLPAGRHALELVNEALGLRQRATAVVEPDRTATVRVELPSAPLNINAQPWAEVTIDDRAYGETPLANLSLPIGEHVVTLRHPSLGERTVLVTVRLGRPNRVSLDLRQ